MNFQSLGLSRLLKLEGMVVAFLLGGFCTQLMAGSQDSVQNPAQGSVQTPAQGSVQYPAQGYSQHAKAQRLMDEMVEQHQFKREELEAWFAQAERKQNILDAISRPAEKTLTWGQYRNIFLKDSRIQKGVEFWRQNREALEAAENKYGVPPAVVVAIIGVETRYGQHKGKHRVLDALSTLAFDYPRRSKFFTKELKQFLLLAREQQRDPLSLNGSYAGAMGYGQFMPSSYRAYATDFDGDGFVDIWNNPVDAIGSVANYFARHGWRRGESVVHRVNPAEDYEASVLNRSLKPSETIASLGQKGFRTEQILPPQASATAMRLRGEQGDEYWVGLKNFYVITRYNHSRLYAMAVYQLSQKIEQAASEMQSQVLTAAPLNH
ncbi:lytic murein transglycosylase B [Pseudomaricurvus alkylphenolicus]|uniref:lytic murein transglycosylase B n=1 Tax=Pseudomaricurvus alkylphenolicus TaxID=1306991 RepID=UPI001F103BD7|nr:lytic murein transglycosylase B [Pseudomaricurvus alkylphenolicus]